MSNISSKQAEKFVGMSWEVAKIKGGERGYKMRAVRIDGIDLTKPAEMRSDRVNVILTDGRVSEAYVG